MRRDRDEMPVSCCGVERHVGAVGAGQRGKGEGGPMAPAFLLPPLALDGALLLRSRAAV